jgi:hypothetical protein
LSKTTASVMGILKDLTVYYKESYKLNVRNLIIKNMSAGEVNAANIKRKFSAAMPGIPFYQEFVEEIIKEDYSKDGPALKDAVLNSLKAVHEKQKVVKPVINFKATLMDGIQAIGGANVALSECSAKIDENVTTLENQKKGFWIKLRNMLRQMMNKEPEEIVYDIQYMDPVKGAPIKERINFSQFHTELDRKTKILAGLSVQGPALTKLSSMAEEQIITYLERSIRDVQNLHRTLTALDEYFKSSVPKESGERIKGIKPELSTIKNSIVRANQLRHEYAAQKEEEEQLKRLGVSPAAS